MRNFTSPDNTGLLPKKISVFKNIMRHPARNQKTLTPSYKGRAIAEPKFQILVLSVFLNTYDVF